MILRFLKYSFTQPIIMPLITIILISILLHIKKQKNENHLNLIGNLIFQLAFMYSMIILVLGFEALAYATENDKVVLITIAISNFLSINFLAGITNVILKSTTQIRFWISKN